MLLTLLPRIKFNAALRTLADDELLQQCEDATALLEEVSTVQKPSQLSLPARGWLGFEYQLGLYAVGACLLWRTERHHNSGPWEKAHDIFASWEPDHTKPPWVGDLIVHRSHRSYLIRNNPDIYTEVFPSTPDLMPVVFPQIVKQDPRGYRLRVTELDEKALRRGKLELPEDLYYDYNKREVLAEEAEGNEDDG